jgi:hypothetical protein
VADAKPRRRRIAEVLGIATVIGAVALGLAYFPQPSDHAIVLVTVEDCRRAFSEAFCRMIVDRAQAIQAETAPSFEQRALCELSYGAGRCSMLKRELIELNRYAPTMIAILTTRDRAGIVPLYDGPPNPQGDDKDRAGRPVYFRGALIGRLMQAKIGGADAPFVADAKGDPLTAAAVRALHGP